MVFKFAKLFLATICLTVDIWSVRFAPSPWIYLRQNNASKLRKFILIIMVHSRQTYYAVRPFYDRHNPSSEQVIWKTMHRFRTTHSSWWYSSTKASYSAQRRSYCCCCSVEKDPNETIGHRSQHLELCPSTMWKILRKDDGIRTYKFQFTQKLKTRIKICAPYVQRMGQKQYSLDLLFQWKNLFTGKAYFLSTSVSRIAEFGVEKTQKPLLKCPYVH